jgi:hypothetical protein
MLTEITFCRCQAHTHGDSLIGSHVKLRRFAYSVYIALGCHIIADNRRSSYILTRKQFRTSRSLACLCFYSDRGYFFNVHHLIDHARTRFPLRFSIAPALLVVPGDIPNVEPCIPLEDNIAFTSPSALTISYSHSTVPTIMHNEDIPV